MASAESASVDLYWLPLGAGDGTGCVRTNGRVYEAVVARREQRTPCRLFHSALEVRLGDQRFTIEMAPVWSTPAAERGVVAEGPVGLPWLGRSRLFRYEVRRWRDGVVPDLAEAVGGARRLSSDPTRTASLLARVPDFPTVTWGRDELGTGLQVPHELDAAAGHRVVAEQRAVNVGKRQVTEEDGEEVL